MSRWRRAFDRIGGPDAVTWWSFGITLVASILSHLTSGGAVTASVPVRVLVVIIAQIAMFVPLVALRLTLLRDPPRPRPWVAVAGFVVATVIRGVALSGILLAIGGLEEPLWLYRIAASVFTQGTILVVVALSVSTIRAHTRTMNSLLIAQRELEAVQARLLDEVDQRNKEALAQVKTRLADEMVALDSMSDEASVQELQRLASDVVRPMSHELATSLTAGAEASAIDNVRVTRQQLVAQMTSTAPMRPVAAALMMGMMMLIMAAGIYGSQGLPLMLVTAGATLVWSWLANRVLALVLPRVRVTAAITAVVIAAVVVGYLTSSAAAFVIRDDPSSLTIQVGGGLVVAGVVLLFALVSAVLRQQTATEVELSEQTERLRRAVVRLRQAQWFQGQALSRALHGPVQSAVTSAALRLDAALRSGQPTDQLVRSIRAELAQVVDVLDVDESQALGLDDSMARIRGLWEGLCSVRIDITDAARECLDADPVAGSTVVDMLTEAVSNSVRHGGATRVEVLIEAERPGVIRLTVRDDGSPSSGSSKAGLGTMLLEECTLEWSRGGVDGGQVLEVVLPCMGAPEGTRQEQ